ncbi:MAG: hypothetical protein AB8B50_21010 [Pirellulaceae bacterium]
MPSRKHKYSTQGLRTIRLVRAFSVGIAFGFALLVNLSPLSVAQAQDQTSQIGAKEIAFYGYSDCIALENESVRVVVCPAAGGRILEYSLNGKNVLYLPAGDEGWVWDGSDARGPMHAGRFDIGPEQVVPPRQVLWQGRWKGEITGDREVKLTSEVAKEAGVYLEREFHLDAVGSRLTCTQTIISDSEKPVEYCHWSRTFATGNGICVVPVSQPQRFSEGWVRYDAGRLLNMKPVDSHVERRGDYLVVSDRPEKPKLGFDSMSGWLAYFAPNDLLFIKTYPTHPDRPYNEVAALTASIWYPGDGKVEVEPIGPRERLEKRGDRASFTETWYLREQVFPSIDQVEPQRLTTLVESLQIRTVE